MEYDEFIAMIKSDISRTLSENTESILKSLISGLPDDSRITEAQLKMCRNSVTVSVHLTTQLIFSYLKQMGLLNL